MGDFRMKYDKYKKEIIYWANLLNQREFVTVRSGNISLKVGEDKILITSHDCYLGYLDKEDILLIDLKGNVLEGDKEITSEKKLHLGIHSKFKDIYAVLHAHPPYTIAFFNYFKKLNIFSFEAKFYLGKVPVIPQKTPIVIDTKPVISALENSNIIVLKNHGVISIGKDFKEAFSLIELLEAQARVNLLLRRVRLK
jgi:L-fuculose-phosphate aldolase